MSVGIDQWYQRRQKDAEGDFYRKIAGQSPQNNFNATTQGLFLATPDGKLLGFTNNRSPEWVKAMLKKGLAAFQPADAALLKNDTPDKGLCYSPPPFGLVITVTAKVLAGHELSPDPQVRMFQESMGRDMLWLRRDENEALARGEVMPSVKTRIARFTLNDFTRGEPAFWAPEDVRSFDLALKDGVLSGTAHVENQAGTCGLKMDLRGVVEAKGGQVTRFDLVARGTGWGHSGTTAVGAPKGKFTLAIAYRLAPGTDEADKVTPQGAKAWFPDYMGR